MLAPIVRGRKGEYEQAARQSWRARGSPARGSTARCATSPSRSGCRKTYKHTIEVVVDRPGRQARHPPAGRRLDRDRARAGRGHRVDRRRRPRRRRGDPDLQPERSPAPTAASPSRSSRRGTSRSTRPTARAPRATASARASRSTPSSSSPTPTSAINEGAIAPWASATLEYWVRVLEAVAEAHGFDLDTPWKKLPKTARERPALGLRREDLREVQEPVRPPARVLDHVRGRACRNIERRHAETDSDAAREKLEQFMREIPCRACKGAGCKPETLAVTIGGSNIAQVTDLSIRDALGFVDGMTLTEREHMIAERLREGDPRPAGVPRRRRPGLPDAGRAGGHARRRRGPADPAGDPDRQRPGRGPLHPRRAVDRSAPAGQPAAASTR